MAAISCIIGSVTGWIVAALALLSGYVASTAFMLFLLTSLMVSAALMIRAAACTPDMRNG